MMTRSVEEEKIVFIIFLCCSSSIIIETRQFRWFDVDWRPFVVRRSVFEEVVTYFEIFVFCVSVDEEETKSNVS